MFCKLKSRRLEEFYREETARQLRSGSSEEEVASDLSTKSPQSPVRSTHLNSSRGTPEYRKVTSSPLTESLQQKLKTFSELSSPNLSICDANLSYKENVKEDDNAKLEGCDKEAGGGDPKTDEAAPVLTDDRAQELAVTGSEGERKDAGLDHVQDDYDVQVLHDGRHTSFVKNDNNNNNNNGLPEEAKQGDPIVKTHGCQDCGKCFSRRQLLVQHRRIHTGERPYSCAECGRQFTQRGHWSTHQKLHEPARRPEHACPSCGKAFVTRASLKVHLRTHTGEKPFQCGECGKQFSQLRNYKYHRSVHEGTREFAASCPECGKYFNDRGYLSSHMKIHRNRKEYGCQFCGKSFNQRVAYNMHVRIHTGERPHSCPHCSKTFSRKMLLKQHLRIHTGEKPFACSVCGKAFADRSNMTLHMRLHSGIKPYSCQLCAKAFTKKHHLKTHLNYHTGTKPYSCGKCGLRFSQSSNMRTHYKKCAGSGLMTLEAPVGKTEEATATPGTNNNGAVSPPSSPSRSDATMTSPETLSAPPHSNNSSCVTSVLPRNAVHAPLPV
ncbi:hypothetical protein L798_14246 [Zootermopsis nevadensis]|uniref:C2H2-type domain-containing protein n=2 Tax=Zootermopsis nevadensis TaxID=136037 RepID=A0A067QSN7_ZOONE|nr:hypothetical protein L798_14246 [Zootermopsis nevadensis]